MLQAARSRFLVSALVCVLGAGLLALTRCGSGSQTSAGSMMRLVILKPVADSLVNDSAPMVVAEFSGGAPDLGSVQLQIDASTVPLPDGWTLLNTGCAGHLPALPDGPHRVRLTVLDTGGLPATVETPFEISTGGGETRVFGQLLDPEGDVGIGGAVVFFEEDPTNVAVTGADGRYLISHAKSGFGLHLNFDATQLVKSDAQGRPYFYPYYKRPVDVLNGAKTNPAPCYLPKVYPLVRFADLQAAGVFDCSTKRFTQPYQLVNADLGVSMSIPAGAFVESRDGTDPCLLSLSIGEVNKRKAPSNLPETADPALLLTIQPTGLRFLDGPGGAPVSIPITFPNKDHLAAGTFLNLFSVDHRTGEFVIKGQMQVDPTDTGRIVTTSGGVEGGSWHCACPPGPNGPVLPDPGPGQGPPNPPPCTNPDVEPSSGLIVEHWRSPRRTLFDESYLLDLTYSSEAVVTKRVLRLDAAFDVRAAVAQAISLSATIDEVPAGVPQFYETSRIDEDATTKASFGFPVDVSGLESGIHRASMLVKNIYANSSASRRIDTDISIARIPDGPWGTGWSLRGDDRIIHTQNGDLAIQESTGNIRRFSSDPVVPPEDRGLTASFFAFQGDMNAAIANFYKDRTTIPITVARPDGTQQSTTSYASPSVNFPVGVNGRMLNNGQDDVNSSSPNEGYNLPPVPQGDDLYFLFPSDSYGILFEGYIYVPEGGFVTFKCEVDDAVTVEVAGHLVGCHYFGAGPQPCPGTSELVAIGGYMLTCEPVNLPAGFVPIRVAFYDADLGGYRLRLFAQGGGLSDVAPIPSKYFAVTGASPVLRSPVLRGTSGDYSTLEPLATGGYVRKYPDGARDQFDADGRLTARIDRRGRTESFTRAPVSGRVDQIRDPAGGIWSFQYAGAHVMAIRDPSGGTTSFGYDGAHLTSIADAAGGTRRYTYTSEGLLTSKTDEDGVRTTHEYDAFGRFLRTRYADGTDRSLDSVAGRLIAGLEGRGTSTTPASPLISTDAAGVFKLETGDVVEYSKDALDNGDLVDRTRIRLDATTYRVTDVITDPDKHLVKRVRVYEGPTGIPGGSPTGGGPGGGIDPTSRAPARSRKLSVEDPLVADTRITWDLDRGLPLSVTESALGQPGVDDHVVQYTWDASAARLLSVTEAPNLPALQRVTSYTYDGTGNVVQVTLPSGGASAFTYEGAKGYRLKSMTSPAGVVTSFDGDSLTGSTSAIHRGGSVWSFTRNAAGEIVTATDPSGAVQQYVRDVHGFPSQWTDANGDITRFIRTAAGRLSSISIPNSTTPKNSWTYDSRGRVATWTDPLGAVATFTYTPDGRVLRYVRHDGVAVDYVYDLAGRQTEVQYRASASTGSPVVVSKVSYGPLDLVTRVEEGASFVAFTHDTLGRRTREDGTVAGMTWAVVSGYDGLGRRTTLDASVAGGSAFLSETFSFDPLDSMTELAVAGLGSLTFQYDSDGGRTSLARPSGAPTTTWSYDALGLLASVDTRFPGQPSAILHDDVTRDASLRVATRTLARTLLAPPSVADTFALDPVGRLSSVASTSPVGGATFGPYDPASNWRSTTCQYDAADRITTDGTKSFVHDVGGRLTERRAGTAALPRRQYSYDIRGRLMQVDDLDAAGTATTVFQASYDPLGRRTSVRGVRRVYDGSKVIALVASGATIATVVQGPGEEEPLAVIDASTGAATWPIVDSFGSVLQSVVGAAVVGEQEVGPYGALLASSGTNSVQGLHYAYRGREYDEQAAVYLNGAREYDPAIGRFLQPEGVMNALLLAGALSSESPYAYALSSPTRLTDADGFAPVPEGGKKGGAPGSSGSRRYPPIEPSPDGPVYPPRRECRFIPGVYTGGVPRRDLRLPAIPSRPPAPYVPMEELMRQGSWVEMDGRQYWVPKVGDESTYEVKESVLITSKRD